MSHGFGATSASIREGHATLPTLADPQLMSCSDGHSHDASAVLLSGSSSGCGSEEGDAKDEPMPAELVELDNTLAADVAAAVAKAAAESEAASMEGSSAAPSEGEDSPPSSPPTGGEHEHRERCCASVANFHLKNPPAFSPPGGARTLQNFIQRFNQGLMSEAASMDGNSAPPS